MSLSLRVTQSAINFSTAIIELALNPVISGALLAAISHQRSPSVLKQYAPALLSALGSLRNERSKTILRVMIGAGIIRWFNRLLNSIALNNWRITAQPALPWHEQIAVVTGGSGGIGQCLVEQLLAWNAKVAVLDVLPLPKGLENNANVAYYRCDLTDPSSIATAAEQIRSRFGHPTILINNAGLTGQTHPTSENAILQMKEERLKRLFGVDCFALWYLAKEFVPEMIRKNSGHVITVSSMAAFATCPMNVDYSASKAAAMVFNEGLASELKHIHQAPGVITTVVHPSFTATPMTEHMASHNERRTGKQMSRESVANQILAQIRAKRGGQIILPRTHSLLAGLRSWPNWLQEVFRDALGKDAAEPFRDANIKINI
ncbi:Dehydrogenase RED2 [Pseudocercospora fuligena]|uniref:Dehydrogenase RED2 n=1 Tax=Pseudocercospora fuligena TaxID=685502 RepID=A0A8H6R4V3_9PEZI|nr:Dehydrogenase RED2 [Pseudocercospora fuligena]